MQLLYSRRINALRAETWEIDGYLELIEYLPQSDLQEPLKQLFPFAKILDIHIVME